MLVKHVAHRVWKQSAPDMEFEIAADAALVANPTQPRIAAVADFIAAKLDVPTHEKNVRILVRLVGDGRIHECTSNIHGEVIAIHARIGESIAAKIATFAGEGCRKIGFGCSSGEYKGIFVNTVSNSSWKIGTAAMEKVVRTLRAGEKWR